LAALFSLEKDKIDYLLFLRATDTDYFKPIKKVKFNQILLYKVNNNRDYHFANTQTISN